MNKLPENLCKMQEYQRQNTINLVLRGISELTSEGYDIKIKDLIERTGLSRSVFAKPHVRKILISYGIASDTAENLIDAPTNKSTRISNLKNKLHQKEEQISKLIAENNVLKEECALLRGK